MIHGHVIALDPTPEQDICFRKACGVARFAYNWALEEWNRIYAFHLAANENNEPALDRPSASRLRKAWNAHRNGALPWSYDVTKCAGAGALDDLGVAFKNLFEDIAKAKRGEIAWKKVRRPTFRCKGERDRFHLWNDQFSLHDRSARIARVPGFVRMREALRFPGKIVGGVVSLRGGRWFLSVQVESVNRDVAPLSGAAPPTVAPLAPGEVIGADVGVASHIALSNGEMIANRAPRKRYLKRQKKLQRALSRQKRGSRRHYRRKQALAKLHHRIACVRKDAIHKATTSIARRFGVVVIENLNVAGMGKNHALAGAIHDAAFGEIRRQLVYKARRVILADRFFASTKTCSGCGAVRDDMSLRTRTYSCAACGHVMDRDVNAARNLKSVGLAILDRERAERGVASPLSEPEPLADGPSATHGDISALAAA